MCQPIASQYIAPGWSCCKCQIYNGIQRTECKQCSYTRCGTSYVQTTPIPRERIDPILTDLVALLRIIDQLLAKVEAELQARPFPDLVKQLNQIDMPEDIAVRFQVLGPRLSTILGVDLTSLAETIASIHRSDLVN